MQSVSSKSSILNGSPTINFHISGAIESAKGFLVLIATPNNIPAYRKENNYVKC